MKKISQFIKEKRQKKRFKATEIAEALNLSSTQVSRYETDRSIPPIEIIIKLSKLLDFSLNELYITPNTAITPGKNLGEKIRNIREKKKLTQEELGKLTNKKPHQIGSYERSESQPNIYTLIEICKILDTSLENLLENEINKCATKKLILF
ncbi:helix-turn-helix domain-containing protein [Peptococcus simiae]|uniref:helix-turn-helix domain-containing protein n=1 Tax=Peptococcus simiae TaxID=1643805 RepID=UPI00397EA2D0